MEAPAVRFKWHLVQPRCAERVVTARQEILEVARGLSARGLSPFSPQQIIDELRRRGSRYPESTIRTHVVSAMCINAPTNHMVTYPDLRRVGRGQYVLASGDDEQGSRPAPTVGSRRSSAVAVRKATAAELSGRRWYWEGHVQNTFVDYLVNEGWHVVAAADTASREPGPDVVARWGDVELLVEVKGYPDGHRPSVNAQARHYAADALLAGLLAWGDYDQAKIGLVFPDVGTYRNLLRRLRAPLERLAVSVWFVQGETQVKHWLDGGLPSGARVDREP